MLEEYFSYSADLMPEGRKAFALHLAVQSAHEHMTAEQILDMAKVFEAWLKSEKPALKAVK